MRHLRTKVTPLNCVEISQRSYQKIYALSQESHRPIPELIGIAIDVFAHSVSNLNIMHQPRYAKKLTSTTDCEKTIAIHNLQRAAAKLTRKEIIEALQLHKPSPPKHHLGVSQEVKNTLKRVEEAERIRQQQGKE